MGLYVTNMGTFFLPQQLAANPTWVRRTQPNMGGRQAVQDEWAY